jgi:hypothetical protein
MMKNPKAGAAGAKPKKAATKSAKTSSTKTAPYAPAVKSDQRSAAAPTAPAAVARKAAEAIASTGAVATAEPKRAVAKPAPAKPAPAAIDTPKPAQVAVEAPKAEPESVSVVPRAPIVPSPEKTVAPLATALEAGADQARAFFARSRATGENLRQAVTDSGTATTRGLIEINGKVLDLVRAQSDATIDLWRSTLAANSFSEAVQAQTSGLRRAYEASATQWREIAETTGRVMSEAAKPFQSALSATR